MATEESTSFVCRFLGFIFEIELGQVLTVLHFTHFYFFKSFFMHAKQNKTAWRRKRGVDDGGEMCIGDGQRDRGQCGQRRKREDREEGRVDRHET